MSNTIIQIKRSTTTAVPNDLQPGELAYTTNGQVLFIGSPVGLNTANVIAIAGQRSPGTLTANQAVIPNANAFIDEFRTNKLVVGPDGTVAANITGISYDGTISGSNNSGTVLLTANAVKTYVESSGFYGINTSDGTNSNTLVSNSTAQDTLTIQGTTNEVTVSLSGDTFTVGLPDSVTVTNDLSTNTLAVTNTSDSSNTTSGAATIAGGLGVAKRINTKELAVGNTSVYTSVNGTVIQTGSVFATNTVNASVLSIGGWVVANNSGVFTSGVVNADIVQVGTYFKANTTQVTLANGVALSVNGSIGTANQVLASNGGGVYWRTLDADIEEVVAGDGLTGGGTTGSVTLNVGAGNGIEVNATAVAVKPYYGIESNSSGVGVIAGTGVSVNSSGVHIGQPVGTTDSVTFDSITINGNAALGNSNSDIISIAGKVNTNIIPSANVSYDLGNEDLSWKVLYANNVRAGYATFDHNVTISGNLTVSGNITTINVSTLVVSDPLIQLASNNESSDTLDIGFFGSYNSDGGTHEHTGLFRDATDGRYKLFDGLTPSPTTTVDTSNTTFNIATLQAYLLSGALSTNSTAVTITANSSVNVALVANTLTLSSPLLGNSGGTGLSSYAAEDILVANSSNGFRKLSVGTVGKVLQSNGSAVVYADLDGGTF